LLVLSSAIIISKSKTSLSVIIRPNLPYVKEMLEKGNSSSQKMIRIGCSSAFWGDSPTGAIQLVNQGGPLDYLVSDYLAEVTMCILARTKTKSETPISSGVGEGGYVREFVSEVWRPLMKIIIERKIRVVTNAGGMNPLGLKHAMETLAKDAGLSVPLVAVLLGDDLLEKVPVLQREESALRRFSVEGEEEPLLGNEDRPLTSFHCYLGATAIAEAFDRGAQVVITGRCVDSALVLGPLIHEFGWKTNDYHLLSSGSLAGHIVECGCQATGGNFTDWELSSAQGWDNVGFPIVECFPDGSFIVTKPLNTGGIVNRFTVAEQMLYEIGDPGNYVLPDVVCDWRNVNLLDLFPAQVHGTPSNRVLVTGARGSPPTAYYKVSVTYLDGFKLGGSLMIGGIDAKRKALAVGKAILSKTQTLLKQEKLPDFLETNLEVLGAEHTYGPHARCETTREVVLRVSARHISPSALQLLAKEFAPAATSMAPGITGSTDAGGRPRPQPVIRFSSCLVAKCHVPYQLVIGTQPALPPAFLAVPPVPTPPIPVPSSPGNSLLPPPIPEGISVPLLEICVGRSGDKGDTANIGLIVRRPEFFDFLRAKLTSQVVKDYMSHLVKGIVKRYELPGIGGLNFVLTRALGSGGVSSLRIDRQGKSYAQMLLSYPIIVPKSWSSLLRTPSKL